MTLLSLSTLKLDVSSNLMIKDLNFTKIDRFQYLSKYMFGIYLTIVVLEF